VTITAEGVRGTRYSWGGDDHVFVEVDEEMSLQANFRVMAITRARRDQQVAGVFDVLSGPEAFVEAHSGSPWFASMVGFVAGLPFLFQMPFSLQPFLDDPDGYNPRPLEVLRAD
jgi:allophanate hydrolase subunit 1